MIKPLLHQIQRRLPLRLKKTIKALLWQVLPWKSNERTKPLVRLFHQPYNVPRRCDELTFNIPGEQSTLTYSANYCLNNNPWQPVHSGAPRYPNPQFCLEFFHKDLCVGKNVLIIEAKAPFGRTHKIEYQFNYSQHQGQPQDCIWKESSVLEVEDGYWETASIDGEWRVRPVPGYEGYDKVLLLSEPFEGGRRVETNMILRKIIPAKEWGYGILPQWGGRPDPEGTLPRRGWLFSLVWYFNRYKGYGAEFSERQGNNIAKFNTCYRSSNIELLRKYSVITECLDERDAKNKHIRYVLRFKWWPSDEAEPEDWIFLDDKSGWKLPERAYAIGLVCYNCQVDFGPMYIKRC